MSNNLLSLFWSSYFWLCFNPFFMSFNVRLGWLLFCPLFMSSLSFCDHLIDLFFVNSDFYGLFLSRNDGLFVKPCFMSISISIRWFLVSPFFMCFLSLFNNSFNNLLICDWFFNSISRASNFITEIFYLFILTCVCLLFVTF